jgi:hypothetical protein
MYVVTKERRETNEENDKGGYSIFNDYLFCFWCFWCIQDGSATEATNANWTGNVRCDRPVKTKGRLISPHIYIYLYFIFCKGSELMCLMNKR